MDKIEFIISDDQVDIFINGKNLIDMIREVEMPFAKAEGHPSIAGGYAGLRKELALLPSMQLLGEPEESYEEDGKTCLLVCGGCGDSGCWPLEAKVSVTGSEVVWSNFVQPHRQKGSISGEWKYDSFGPFHFDKQQYREALQGKTRRS